MTDLSFLRRLRQKRKRRSPSRPPRWMPVLIALAVVAGVAALAIGLRLVLTASPLSIRRIEVTGAARLTDREVTQAGGVPVGAPLLLTDLTAMRARIASLATVQDVAVARRLPDTLEVRIVERTPLATLDVGGVTQYVDETGHLFGPGRAQPADERLPEIRHAATLTGSRELAAVDRPALVALTTLRRVTGVLPPIGTYLDLAHPDRVLMQPGPDAPLLLLDRREPAKNIENLYVWQGNLAQLAPGQHVDLRFAHRLTVVPIQDGTTAR